MRATGWGCCLALVLLVAGCGGGGGAGEPDGAATGGDGGGAADAAPDPVTYPTPDWDTDDPAAHGLDPDKLDESAAVAAGNGSHCLLVIRGGKLVYERYFADADAATIHQSWSLAKSYTGTLVGIAVDRGELALHDPVAQYVPAWQDGERDAITVRDLVSMTSGLKWSAFQDYVQMAVFAENHTDFAVALPASEPRGSAWLYHNGGVQVLEAVFRAATGVTIEAYAEEHLWGPLGMSATWDHDPSGNPTPYANVLATCRDHARLGYLYLHGGRWDGQQVVSSDWIDQAITPSQAYNRAYGYLFWLNAETPAINAMNEPWPDRMAPFAPPDLFAAHGFGNQFIDVIPSLDLMVIRFGEDPATGMDIGALTSDSRFEKHDAILRPILDGVTD